MNKKNLYLLTGVLGGFGYLWLYVNYKKVALTQSSWCLTKNIAGIPCPACGSTRSALYIMEGNFIEAALLNPLGYLVLLMLVVLPFWIILDVVSQKNSFYLFYKKIEGVVQKKYIAIGLVLVILLNWIWNINKGL